ncbi:MAG: peptidoglycan DD-metalloendopeptidase family protein [Anaerolineae bacterium]|nr:peptidoglycan DD-metalloendopeptidase family protein [Anaerolineae bacterium]
MSEKANAASDPNMKDRLVSFVGWVIALGMVGLAFYFWQLRGTVFAQGAAIDELEQETVQEIVPVPTTPPHISLPPFKNQDNTDYVSRVPSLHTTIPTRPRTDILQYQVDTGDSVFGIASFFGIEPETVLWANYDLLNDNPDFLEPGMELYIPPLDGVYYQWQGGDTLSAVAEEFEAKLDDILSFLGNNIDLTNPVIEEGQMIMIPQGRREFRQWLIPTIARGSAGVNTTALGPGACSGSYDGLYGSGAFIWPTGRHFVSGNDYWSGHLGLDLAAVTGDNIFSSDAGVVVFAGWANGGYGNTVMVDHGNGYQSLYAHLNSVAVGCGASVSAGSTVGYAGSTGNSTGAHLHFEVRLNGGFINPWFVLPAP